MDCSIDYTYKRQESPAPELLGKCLSRHHVLPYAHMYALGAILLAYAKIQYTQDNPAPMGRLTDFLNDHTIEHKISFYQDDNRFFVQLGSENSILDGLNKISWFNGNLFVGPSAALRTDDPGQCDDAVPCSMPKNAKKCINDLKNYYKRIPCSGNMPHINETQGHISLSENHLNYIASNLLNCLEGNNHLNIYSSLVGDWVGVLPSGKGNPLKLYLLTPEQNNFPRRETQNYKLRLRTHRDNFDHIPVLQSAYLYNARGALPYRMGKYG